MDLRLRFITDYLSGLHSATELAADDDISRKTAHYWIRHYFAAFPLALFNERTWRLQSPSASSPPQPPRS